MSAPQPQASKICFLYVQLPLHVFIPLACSPSLVVLGIFPCSQYIFITFSACLSSLGVSMVVFGEWHPPLPHVYHRQSFPFMSMSSFWIFIEPNSNFGFSWCSAPADHRTWDVHGAADVVEHAALCMVADGELAIMSQTTCFVPWYNTQGLGGDQ
jgi:hypothetical protein